ncbi:FtsK/SpoIIIE domain-containing protein [Paramicrobacterium agarici]|uniref:FtsK/SpoIIIE domain-containing protein n=1 Tax=Paramicrobacterium agarici TaxID=630514 RepID=UPI0011545238|nr:FtsK/SpoIIIE domain-containing protein [Microbacterium agarici]TQO24255.1 FtsK/SpoIIIE family protein [Microbacterium agarici]
MGIGKSLARGTWRIAKRTTRAGVGSMATATGASSREARQFGSSLLGTALLWLIVWGAASLFPAWLHGIPVGIALLLAVLATLRLLGVPGRALWTKAGAISAAALVLLWLVLTRREWLVGFLPSITWPDPWMIAAAAVAAGVITAIIARLQSRDSGLMKKLGPLIARALGVPWEDFRTAANLKSDRAGVVTVTHIPAVGQLNALTKAQAKHNLTALLPSFELDPTSDALTALRLIPASAETLARRAISAESEGLIVSTTLLSQEGQPRRERWEISPEASQAVGPHIERFARSRQMTLIEHDFYSKLALVGELDPLTESVRTRWADLIGCFPWDLSIDVSPSAEGLPSPVKTVTLRKSGKPLGSSPEQKKARLRELSSALPGSAYWLTREDPASGTTTWEQGTKPELPTRCSLDFDFYKSGEWGQLAIGADWRGRQVWIDLASTPHTGVFGTTGFGKSVAIQGLIYGALARGFELAIVEPVKHGNDFDWIKGYVRPGGWGCEGLDDALAVVRGLHEEAQRRGEVMSRFRGVQKWTELPEDIRREEGIKPILLVLDEFTGIAAGAKGGKTLPKGSPEADDMESRAAASALILYWTSRILAESRSAGIHCVVATQVWNVSQIGSDVAGAMRLNLGSRLQFGTASTTALAQAFTDASKATAAYTFAHGEQPAVSDDPNEIPELDSGGIVGRGVIEVNGRGYSAFQGAYAPVSELEEHLSRLGLPATDPRDLRPHQDGSPPPRLDPLEELDVVAEPAEVIELDEITFTLSDFEDEEAGGPAPTPSKLKPAPTPDFWT